MRPLPFALTWGLGLGGVLFLPPIPEGWGMSRLEALAAPFVFPLLQLALPLVRPLYRGLAQAEKALGLAAWAFLAAEAGFLRAWKALLEAGAGGALAGLALFGQPFFLLVGGMLLAFGWVLATDPPPPNPVFGAVTPRGLNDPAFFVRASRASGRFMLAWGSLLFLAALGLPRWVGLEAALALTFLLALLGLAALAALPWVLARRLP